ncbi:hypothetical protein [Chrysiogenes arsenatis]|nr:hypothetical protein [Chrysiogenes arsenatis]
MAKIIVGHAGKGDIEKVKKMLGLIDNKPTEFIEALQGGVL